MKSELISVFKGSPMDAEIVEQVLNDHDIQTNTRNKFMGSIAPWHVSSGGMDPVEIEVLSSDVEKALLLINEFNIAK